MEINCKFKTSIFDGVNRYWCIINDADINEKEHAIKSIKGVHDAGKSHQDVELVFFSDAKVNYFPRGLNKHFPNLTQLSILDSALKEISRNDLMGLEGLFYLRIANCQLTSVPDDLFSAMPNLNTVSFRSNKIVFASSKFLEPLLGRGNVAVSLLDNKCIDAWFWPGGNHSLKSLEELMKLIDEKCIKFVEPVNPDPLEFNPKIKQLWQTRKYSDLTIIAGDNEFKVHKNILAMQSAVFDQIFMDQFEATEIRIPEFSTNAVEALLNFIYTSEVSDDENANKNFEIAVKFKVDAMKSKCEEIICSQLDKTNALDLFLFAHRFSSQLLKEKAFHEIAKNLPDDVPEKLMEDPESLKQLLIYRKAYEEILEKSK